MNFKDQSIAFRFLMDVILVTLAFFVASYVGHHFNLVFRKRDILHLSLLYYSWYHFTDRIDYYRDIMLSNAARDLLASLKMSVLMTLVYVVVAFLVDTGGEERTSFVVFLVLSSALTFLKKYVFRRVYRFVGNPSKVPIVFIGYNALAKEITDKIRLRPWMGYSVKGVVDADKETDVNEVVASLEKYFSEGDVQKVFVQESRIKKANIDQIITTCLSHTVQPYIVPDGLKFFSERYQVQFFDDIPIIAVRKNPLERFRYRTIKRAFDLAFSGILLLTVLPIVFGMIAVAIKLTSKGPVFFVQKRWGMNNVPFDALKFRSMTTESSDVVDGKYQQAQKNDPRITKVGAFLRKTNLDELPQFVNVFLGDMSVVGPRPHPGPLNEESKDVVDFYLQRHLVKPGITGWAQVNGARGETRKVSQMQKRIDLDIWYIENWSFFLDVRIILQTVWNMYKGEEHAY